MIRRAPGARRSAAAAVELAFMMPFLLILLLGVWEVGRLIEVQQILNDAAREGARLASLGHIINQNSAATDPRRTPTPRVPRRGEAPGRSTRPTTTRRRRTRATAPTSRATSWGRAITARRSTA